MNIQSSRLLAPVSVALLAIAILIAQLLIFVVPAWGRQAHTGDELTSFLAATGHLAEYNTVRWNETYPAGQWVPASEWQRFLQVEEGRGLPAVANDMFYWDVHPPLYFWLLHGWLHVVPYNLWMGTLLNWMITLLAAVVLYLLAKHLFKEPLFAYLTVAAWLLSPTLLRSAYLARHYVLTTFWTILLAYFLFRFLSSTEKKERLLLLMGAVVASVAGILTHYLFLFVVAGAFFVAMVEIWARIGRAARIGVGLLAAAAAIVALAFVVSGRLGAMTYFSASLETAAIHWDRLPKLGVTLIYLCLPILVALFLVVVGRWVGKSETAGRAMVNSGGETASNDSNGRLLLQLLALTLIPYVVQWILTVIDVFASHTMTVQYVIYLSPYVALMAVALLVRLDHRRRLVNWFIVLLVGLALATSYPRVQSLIDSDRYDLSGVAGAPYVLIDRINVPTFLMQLDEDQLVYAASQGTILERPNDWLPRLAAEGGHYISHLFPADVIRSRRDATLEGREQILEQIAAVACYERISETRLINGMLAIYRVQPRGAGTCPAN